MRLDQLIRTVTSYTHSSDTAAVLKTAFQIVENAHNGYQRISGEPFVSHPLSVAETLAQWHAPLPIVAVGLLHDIRTLDYSNGYIYAVINIEKQLGPEISHLLEIITELNGTLREMEREFDAGVDTVMLQHHITSVLQHDWEIVLVKLADRLHNLQTINALRRSSQERAARIGFNLLAPLADQLGIDAVKRQLEDYCFQIFSPLPYAAQKQHYDDPAFQREVNEVLEDLQQLFHNIPIKNDVRWQPASLYKLYCHQIEQNAKLGKSIRTDGAPLRMADAGSFIVVTEEEIDCYTLLGWLHKHLSPIGRQFRDFIGSPKENKYRSLHTQVKDRSGRVLHVILRTQMMDLTAEHGITARWRDVPKEFLPQLPEVVKQMDEEIQVFSSNGKVRDLPRGATVLDFAYSIHTDVGHHCAGALVNGEQADRYKTLSNGDRVEVISGPLESGPEATWLDHVRTRQAINYIRQWLTQHQRPTMLELGRHLLDKELQQLGRSSIDPHVHQLLSISAIKEGLSGVEDLFVSIGVGRHQAPKLVEQLKSRRVDSSQEEPLRSILVLSPKEADHPFLFASCCRPVPPDDIVGSRRTEDQMLLIHKRGCTQLNEAEKTIQVKWDMGPTEPNYVIVVAAYNRPGLASDLSSMIALSGIDMAGFSAYRRADGIMAEAHIYLARTTSTQRSRIQRELESMPYVTQVEIMPSSFHAAAQQHPSASRPLYQPNPYGPTVASGTRFYGREAECQRIFTLLRDTSQNTTILLWGQKRIGKTSLVRRLQEQLQGEFLSVYMDMQGLRESSTSVFLYQLMSRISLAFKEKTEQEINIPAFHKMKKDPTGYFDAFIDRLPQDIWRYPLIVILDEFQALCSLRQEIISREAIFGRLRGYSQQGRGIRFILSGGGLKSRLIDQCDMSSLLNSAYDLRLDSLEIKDVHLLVKDGLEKVGKITPHAIDLLFDLTSGHPYYLQLLCYSLYEWVQESKTLITSDVVAQHIRGWLDTIDESRFQHLWEGHDALSAQRNKLILSAIAGLGSGHHNVELQRLVSVLGSLVPEQGLVQALRNLADMGVVDASAAGYSVKVELFARWMRKHWPLELAIKEVD